MHFASALSVYPLGRTLKAEHFVCVLTTYTIFSNVLCWYRTRLPQVTLWGIDPVRFFTRPVSRFSPPFVWMFAAGLVACLLLGPPSEDGHRRIGDPSLKRGFQLRKFYPYVQNPTHTCWLYSLLYIYFVWCFSGLTSLDYCFLQHLTHYTTALTFDQNIVDLAAFCAGLFSMKTAECQIVLYILWIFPEILHILSLIFLVYFPLLHHWSIMILWLLSSQLYHDWNCQWIYLLMIMPYWL